MTMDQQLRKVFHELFGIPPEQCDDGTSMETVKGWDSVSHLTLVLRWKKRSRCNSRPKTSRS